MSVLYRISKAEIKYVTNFSFYVDLCIGICDIIYVKQILTLQWYNECFFLFMAVNSKEELLTAYVFILGLSVSYANNVSGSLESIFRDKWLDFCPKSNTHTPNRKLSSQRVHGLFQPVPSSLVFIA